MYTPESLKIYNVRYPVAAPFPLRCLKPAASTPEVDKLGIAFTTGVSLEAASFAVVVEMSTAPELEDKFGSEGESEARGESGGEECTEGKVLGGSEDWGELDGEGSTEYDDEARG